MNQNKVFGIGLPRTGTLSLAIALDILGFRPAVHNPSSMSEIAEAGNATDATVACRFTELATLWPDAKFVYATRRIKPWLKSCEWHYHKYFRPMIEVGWNTPETYHVSAFAESYLRIYGTLEFDPGVWVQSSRNHFNSVCRFFSASKERLLVIDLTDREVSDQEKWGRLAEFLHVESVPLGGFPWEHKTE